MQNELLCKTMHSYQKQGRIPHVNKNVTTLEFEKLAKANFDAGRKKVTKSLKVALDLGKDLDNFIYFR